MLAIAGAGIATVAITVDRLGILNGVPHPVNLLGILGFAFIAAGLWFTFFRRCWEFKDREALTSLCVDCPPVGCEDALVHRFGQSWMRKHGLK